ncbi:PREDICTED: spermatogenesis-associated protein 31D1-like, partial [Miniopterus natalensis]|uniref:spermatogenesis-associated protein 31D1-like n=1 Tax=Miniopterus natalensis TaxID=291302 RepID=UPI0007A6EA32
MTPLGNFLSPSQPGQTLPSEPSPPSESKFPVSHSPPQPKDLLSSTLTQCDFHQELPALHSTKTSFGGDPAAKLIDPRHLLFLSPDEHDSVQQYSNPKILEDLLKQKLIQLFWGLPSLHSESLPSAVHVSSDYSSIFIFNSMSNAFTDQESRILPYHLSPSLSEVYPQPLPQTLPQSQPLPLNGIQPQAHLQSPHPILPSSPIAQIRACGVYFHRPKSETERLTSSEIQHLECNVLQKKQERLWGLPSVVQSSKKDSCPSVPTSPYRRPSKAHLAISISPVGFPLSSELREKFEHYLRKRLIQHRWGLPRRVRESLSLMKPLREFSDIPESKSSCGFSWISVDKGQSSKNPNVGLSQPGSFYERGSEMFQLDQDEGKGAGHSQENDPKVHLSSDSERSSDKDVGNDSDMMSLSGENSIVSGQPGSQRQLEKGLKAHLSKKFEEINEDQLSRTVHSSQHTTKQTLPVKSNTEIKQRSLPPSVGGDNCLDTSQELSFLKSGTQQMLEAHITKFRVRMLRGLPTKVLESIEVLKLKHASSHSLMDPNSSSSTKLTSEVNAKSGGFMTLRGSSKSLHRDEVGTENSATVLDLPLPATSLVGKEGQGTLRQSPADIKHGLSEAIRKIWNSKPTLLPVTNSISGKTNQRHSLIANIQPPKLSARQAGTGHEPETKRVNASDRAEIQQGTNREKSEPASMSKVSRAIVRAEELDALQPKTGDVLTTSKLGISQRINVNESDGDTAVTAEKPSKISAPQDLNFSNLKKQVIAELKLKLEERKHRQAQGQPADMSHDSD